MNRSIRKVAVLGSGIMGSRIACHFANIGVEVLLLDIAPRELSEDEKKKGLALDHPSVKNRIVHGKHTSNRRKHFSRVKYSSQKAKRHDNKCWDNR